MGYLTLQIILLILVAFVIGILLGCLAKRLFARSPAETASGQGTTDTDAGMTVKPDEKITAVSTGPAGQASSGKPATLSAPRGGKSDDLKRIKGIGKVNEGRLNKLGIYHFEQIAAWGPSEVEWVDDYLSFKGRIQREDWIGQAKNLVGE